MTSETETKVIIQTPKGAAFAELVWDWRLEPFYTLLKLGGYRPVRRPREREEAVE